MAVPTEASLAAVIKDAGAAALTAYVDTVSATPLLEPLPKPGTVAKAESRPSGLTEWTLSNGVRVVLQPTTFKQDEVLFRAFSPGGTSLAADGDFIAAETADRIVAQGGLGTLSAIDLSKKLAGKAALVRPGYRRDVRGTERPGVEPRSGDDVPVDLSDVHPATCRRRSIPHRDRTAERGAGQPPGASRKRRSRTRSRPRSARITCARCR